MSDLQQATVKLVLDALHSTNLTIESFMMMAISVENPLSRSFLNGGIETLLDSLHQNVLISVIVSNWVTRQAMKIYKEEMSNLTSKENGFFFLTAKMTQEQLWNFDIEDLMKRMMVIAPDLWRLMETLHAANSCVNHQCAWTQKRSKRVCEGKGEAGHIRNRHKGNIEMTDVQTIWEPDDKEEEHYWRTVEADEFELIGEEEDELEDIQDQEKTWFEALA